MKKPKPTRKAERLDHDVVMEMVNFQSDILSSIKRLFYDRLFSELKPAIDSYVVEKPDDTGCFKQRLRDCFRQGFIFALLRYADELKENPEAAEALATLLAAHGDNSKKGILAIKRKAALKKKEAKRLDRLLRNTVKKKYLRVERIAKEMNAKGMKTSERNVERNLSRKKKPIG